MLFTHHGPNRVFKTCQSQAQSNKWCLDYFVVLGTVLVAGANYPPRKKRNLKKEGFMLARSLREQSMVTWKAEWKGQRQLAAWPPQSGS